MWSNSASECARASYTIMSIDAATSLQRHDVRKPVDIRDNRELTRNLGSAARTDSKLHSSGDSDAILSIVRLSFSMSSLVIRFTSSGACVHDGAAWGGESEAIAGLCGGDVEEKESSVASDRCPRPRIPFRGGAAQFTFCSVTRLFREGQPKLDLCPSVARPATASAPMPSSVRCRRPCGLAGGGTLEPARRSVLIPDDVQVVVECEARKQERHFCECISCLVIARTSCCCFCRIAHHVRDYECVEDIYVLTAETEEIKVNNLLFIIAIHL